MKIQTRFWTTSRLDGEYNFGIEQDIITADSRLQTGYDAPNGGLQVAT